MELGTDFLTSRLARKFCILFLVCAFLPTVALIYFSYQKVVHQIEQQSVIRLKRDASAYGFSLFDRMIRLDNELSLLGKTYLTEGTDNLAAMSARDANTGDLFLALGIHSDKTPLRPIFHNFDTGQLLTYLTKEHLDSEKPFILTIRQDNGRTDIFFAHNLQRQGNTILTTLGWVNPEYLWGIGPSPLLPPQTELSVFNSSGTSIIASNNGMSDSFDDYHKNHPYKDLRIFEYRKQGNVYLASSTNLFIESRFQDTGWLIILSQAKSDIMSAMQDFSKTFPFIILLFLLVILYLSVMFIRKGLYPLELLKEGTTRISRREFATKVEITSNDEFQELGNAFNDMTAKLDNQFTTLRVLSEIDRAILSSIERPTVIATTLQSLKEFFHCDLCLLAKNSESALNHIKTYKLLDEHPGEPTIEYFALQPADTEALFTDSQHLILKDQTTRPEFLYQAAGEHLADYLCLPLSIDGKVNRALFLGWRKPHVYNEDQLSQARKITDQLAIALSNSLHMENLEKLAMGTIEALARTVDAKSKWTAGHSERVAVLAGRIGKRLGLNDKALDTISRGGLLHDIGKIGIPLAILDKPHRLDNQEYEEIKTHPTIGGKILEPIKAFQDILPIITQHHEKFDGTGYPCGLTGESIDIRARILAVADVWDALVSERPYREGWIHNRAKKVITEGAGTHFDPKVVDAFLAVVAKS